MQQCKETYPNSSIHICIRDAAHDGKHHTYDVNGNDFYWNTGQHPSTLPKPTYMENLNAYS